jgi:hypothetical protein
MGSALRPTYLSEFGPTSRMPSATSMSGELRVQNPSDETPFGAMPVSACEGCKAIRTRQPELSAAPAAIVITTPTKAIPEDTSVTALKILSSTMSLRRLMPP